MRNAVIVIGFCAIAFLSITHVVWTQEEGFVSPPPQDSAVQQSELPPGATYQGGNVLHVVLPGENLHLLAAFYYGNPREWARIYRENRSVIPNPRVLKVGQKLRIVILEGWKPAVPYQEWFRLATRNGEWTPKSWKRLQRTSGRQSGTIAPKSSPPPDQEVTTPPTVSQDTPAESLEVEPPVVETAPAAETSDEEIPPAGIY